MVKAPQEAVFVGPYQVGNCIGKGAFGTVYKGLNADTGEVVAIKQFELSGLPEDEIKSLSAEIDLLTKLTHPRIVRYISSFRDEVHLSIILEYVENGSLSSSVKNFGRLPEKLVSNFLRQMLEGIDFLHNNQVIHCDIKGANILTTKDGQVKLTDFGVSRKFIQGKKDGASPVPSGPSDDADIVGSPYWMAPEVIEMKGITPAADLWSVGCTAIELLTGQPPYIELAPMAAMFRIVEDQKPPIPRHCGADCVDFISKCLIKDPASRPTAAELLKHPFVCARPALAPHVPISPFATDPGIIPPSPITPFPNMMEPPSVPATPAGLAPPSAAFSVASAAVTPFLDSSKIPKIQNPASISPGDLNEIKRIFEALSAGQSTLSPEKATTLARALGLVVPTNPPPFSNGVTWSAFSTAITKFKPLDKSKALAAIKLLVGPDNLVTERRLMDVCSVTSLVQKYHKDFDPLSTKEKSDIANAIKGLSLDPRDFVARVL